MSVLPVAASGAGTVVQTIGVLEEARATEQAQRANAAFFREQAELARIASEREEDILRREGEELVGAQIGAFAKAGVDLSGSALLRLAQTEKEIAEETLAIREEKRRRVRLAFLRAEDAENQARATRRIGKLRAIGTILGGGSEALRLSRTS